MRYLDIDQILSEEERVPCVFNSDASGLGNLDSTNHSVDLPAHSKVELPLWLTQVLSEKYIIDIELPKYYGVRIREDIMAGASSVKLREYSFYYFEVGLKLSKLTKDSDLSRTLRTAFSGERYKSLLARAMSNWHDDIADYTQSLTAYELKLFQGGYAAARELLQWRTGDLNTILPASVLGKVARADGSEFARKKNRIV